MDAPEAMDLHPLLETFASRKLDVSVDTSAQHVGDGEVAQEAFPFGRPVTDTQGPAGSRAPDWDDRPCPTKFEAEEEQQWGYGDDSDAPPDSAGPLAPVGVEMRQEDYAAPGGDAAAAAVLACRRAGLSGSSQMLEALEAAEDAFEAAQRAQQAHGGAGPGGQEPADAPPPDTPRKAAICEATRERIIQKLFEGLQANPRYAAAPAREVMCHAQQVEDALFARSHSKQVYLCQVSNAVRLARTAPDAADIPRIAAGEPREVAEGHTAGEPTPYITGLQGYVIKPEY